MLTMLSTLVSRLSKTAARPYSTSAQPPLRILFFGSDAFSIESLRALDHARHADPALIEEIHVAHRPPKPTGRGLKTLREVPIAAHARALSLPTHALDSLTHWTPPSPPNLIIAVSFGLLIPPRLLALTPNPGLNVHPSLLPDLRGAAPIPHALLKQRTHTGASVQTLHPSRFDAGTVLAQTEKPGLKIDHDETADMLEARLAKEGARLLMHVLRERRYVDPVKPSGWYTGIQEAAPKLTKHDAQIDFTTMSLDRVMAAHRALGDVWCLLPNGERLVLHTLQMPSSSQDQEQDHHHQQPGLFFNESTRTLLFRAACGRVAVVTSSTYPGGKARSGNAKAARVLRDHQP